MAAKDVYFSADARDRMLRGVNTIGNAVKVIISNRVHPEEPKPYAASGESLSIDDMDFPVKF